MPEYRVYGQVSIGVEIVVNAENEADAREKADAEWPGLEDMSPIHARGLDKQVRRIGLRDQRVELTVQDGRPEWHEVEEV